MRMTRQQFQFFARLMRDIRSTVHPDSVDNIDHNILPRLADDLAKTNQNFNRQKFIEACKRDDPT